MNAEERELEQAVQDRRRELESMMLRYHGKTRARALDAFEDAVREHENHRAYWTYAMDYDG